MMANTRMADKQQGVALVVSLILLLVMTLLGLSSMQATILEEKMAGNFKNRNMSLQAAESALRAAESNLQVTAVLPAFDGSVLGLYQPTISGVPIWDVITWSISEVIAYTGTLSDISASPAYIIEEMPIISEAGSSLEVGVAGENRYYRITTRAVGGTATAVVMLQSTYKR
ncbi:Type IV fimbrial biogenesis protein PilX [hydrothermal vent metagenome]|uniref:Type IV fimbrial biogenesis protein PilX n=1 Tax=hydrothermal vent metagenome TaxID=652676 RepID=A0A3B1BFA4_9ZZZZ